MAPTDAAAEERRKELKAKLAEKKNTAHKPKKLTKEEAKNKEKADKDAKDLAEKEKAAKQKADKEKREADAKLRAAAPPPRPEVWADEKDEASQLGIHLGITCDGCGKAAPLIGKAWKCKDCPDFDLCDKCYPDRLDRHREAVAAAAGMPGKGRHPTGHNFAPRKAGVPMTATAVAAEIAAAEAAEKEAAKNAPVPGAPMTAGMAADMAARMAARTGVAAAGLTLEVAPIWRPSTRNAKECPTPNGHPAALGKFL